MSPAGAVFSALFGAVMSPAGAVFSALFGAVTSPAGVVFSALFGAVMSPAGAVFSALFGAVMSPAGVVFSALFGAVMSPAGAVNQICSSTTSGHIGNVCVTPPSCGHAHFRKRSNFKFRPSRGENPRRPHQTLGLYCCRLYALSH